MDYLKVGHGSLVFFPPTFTDSESPTAELTNEALNNQFCSPSIDNVAALLSDEF